MLFTNKEGELKKQKIMSVRNKLYQEKCTGNPKKGKWYARAVINDVVGLEEISQEILDNTTAKQADVYGVLKELDNVMGQHLKNGDRVVLNGFGSFKVGLKTTAAETAKDFTPQKNIVSARLNFQPKTHRTATDRTRRKQFIQGIEVRQVAESKTKDKTPEKP